MDLVYFMIPWKNNSIELRYSLMFLWNFNHRKVFIVGHNPAYTKCVNVIPFEDVPKKKMKNLMDKFRLIVDNPDISDDFVWIHDDMMILKPLDRIPLYRWESLKDRMGWLEKKIPKNWYWKAVNAVYQKFPDWYNAELHQPFVFNKVKLKEILDKYTDDEIGAIKSFYYNYWKLKWESEQICFKVSNFEHITDKSLERDFLSTGDDLSYHEKFWEMLDNKMVNIPDSKKYQYIRDDSNRHLWRNR